MGRLTGVATLHLGQDVLKVGLRDTVGQRLVRNGLSE